jgi:hypothetical protein
MSAAAYCFCPRGDTPGSARVFDALSTGCIPVIISDQWVGPFATRVPWDKFIARVPENEFLNNPSRALDALVYNHDLARAQAALARWVPEVLFTREPSGVSQLTTTQNIAVEAAALA